MIDRHAYRCARADLLYCRDECRGWLHVCTASRCLSIRRGETWSCGPRFDLRFSDGRSRFGVSPRVALHLLYEHLKCPNRNSPRSAAAPTTS